MGRRNGGGRGIAETPRSVIRDVSWVSFKKKSRRWIGSLRPKKKFSGEPEFLQKKI